MRIKWLHLSDIHFNYKNFDSRILRKDFIDRIRKENESEGFTHLFLTGDILDKYNLTNESDAETVAFINDLIIAMKIETNNVFIVPGNHDHDRDTTISLTDGVYSDPSDDESICKRIQSLDSDRIDGLLKAFEKFSAVYDKVLGNPYYHKGSSPHLIYNQNNLSIIKINTAWLDTNSENTRNLRCGTEYLLDLLEENQAFLNQGVNIAVGHHPLDELASEEKHRILTLFQRYNIGLYFCGHVHRPSIVYFKENDVLQFACTGGFANGYSEGGYVSGICDTDNNLYRAEFYNWNEGSWSIESKLNGTDERGVFYFNTNRFKHNSNIVAVDFKLYDKHISRLKLVESIGDEKFDTLIYPYGELDPANIDWRVHERNISSFSETIKYMIENNQQVHIYPLAPIPLLFKLGFELQNNSSISVHQYSRTNDNWCLSDEEEGIDFDVKKQIFGAKELIVRISTSNIIDDNLINRTFAETNYDTIEFTATKIGFGSPLYTKDVKKLVGIIFNHLNPIATMYEKIHLIAAIPAGMALEIGRNLLNTVYYNIYTYQLHRGKYCEAIVVNEENNQDYEKTIDNNAVYIEEYQQHIIFIPIVGKIACGELSEPIFETDEYMPMSKSILGAGEYFVLKADGDSMIDAGINNGDLVLIRQQPTAENGQIVVALIDDETTLKRFYRDDANKQIILKPENKAYKEQRYKKINIQGIAVKIIKDI